jgi:predicted small secreted protein
MWRRPDILSLPLDRYNDGKECIMTKNTLRSLAVLGLLVAAPLLSACHATQGAGQDIKDTGQAISNTAAKHTP